MITFKRIVKMLRVCNRYKSESQEKMKKVLKAFKENCHQSRTQQLSQYCLKVNTNEMIQVHRQVIYDPRIYTEECVKMCSSDKK